MFSNSRQASPPGNYTQDLLHHKRELYQCATLHLNCACFACLTSTYTQQIYPFMKTQHLWQLLTIWRKAMSSTVIIFMHRIMLMTVSSWSKSWHLPVLSSHAQNSDHWLWEASVDPLKTGNLSDPRTSWWVWMYHGTKNKMNGHWTFRLLYWWGLQIWPVLSLSLVL